MADPSQRDVRSERRGKARWLRRLLVAAAGFLGLVVLLGLVFGLWFRAQLQAGLPIEEGRLAVDGLSAEVEVQFDALGIPVIRGARRLDVAVATGFVHAQNRFFQMDLQRRRAAGELAELVGRRALGVDRGIRIHRLRARAVEVIAGIAPAQRELLEAYTSGVNAGLEALGAKPFEYVLLRSEPQPWRPEDSILVVLSMFVQLQDETGADESAIGLIYDFLPSALARFLTPQGTEWDAPMVGEALLTPPIPGPEEVDLRSAAQSVAHSAGQPPAGARPASFLPAAASNSWAVAGEHTADGEALLATDMHLPLSVPNIWYRASFVWPRADGGGEHRTTGATLPGAPVVVVGSNGDVAWGFTNLQGDAGDVILLDVDPTDENSYLTPEGPRRFQRYEEIIRVKGEEEERLEVLATHWGPVIGNDARSRPRCLRWNVYLEGAVNLGIIDLETVRDVDEAVDVAHRLGVPLLNFMVADRHGRIGWTVAGRLPRRIGFGGRRPSSWTDGTHRWQGLLPPAEVPRIVDPESGRLWTANNRTVDGDMLAKLGDDGYVSGARARQIRDALMELEAATPQDMLSIQLDDRALFLSRWRDLLLDLLTPEALAADPRRAEFRRLVEDWGGRAAAESAGYRLVFAFRLFFLRELSSFLTAPCEQADPDFRYLVAVNQHEGPLWRTITERPLQLLPPQYDNWEEFMLSTVDYELDYYAERGRLAEQTWGRYNTSAIHHPLALPGLGRWLNMPREQLPGDSYMPRVQHPRYGASQRMVVSPGQEEKGIFHMPGGQSGHPSSPHYRDAHAAWVHGEATPFLPGETLHSLTLVPP
ncbi:MAG: penicillin acylase family protein [bacterium]|nr:penicillin acylase family protein [bacterium]